MGFFKRLFGLEKDEQELQEVTENPIKDKPVSEPKPIEGPAPIEKQAFGEVSQPTTEITDVIPNERITPEPEQQSKIITNNQSVSQTIEEIKKKQEQKQPFNIHNVFGIDLNATPNVEWAEADAEIDEKGRIIRNFHIETSKFDDVNARVVGTDETIISFINRQGIDKALELYYILLRDLKYEGHWQLWQCQNAHTKKFLDNMTYEDSWAYDNIRIGFKWERYLYTTTITIQTPFYNKEFLGEPQSIDVYNLETISENNFFGVDLNPSTDKDWELVNESGSQKTYNASIDSDKYIFDSCEISVSFYEYTFYGFTKQYTLENALKAIFMIEKAFGDIEIDTIEKCMKKYGGKLKSPIYWNKNDNQIDYSYDANEHTFTIAVWAFHNALSKNPYGKPLESEANPEFNSLPEKYYSIAKVRVQGIDKLDEDDREYIMNDLEEDTHVYLRNVFDNPKDCHTLQVLHHDNIIGYIDSKKAELVHSYLRNGKIGAIVVSKIKSKDFKVFVDLSIYYEDAHGEEFTPYYPLEGRQLSVIETDLWTGQESWSEDWYLNLGTDELSYKFNDMYDDSVEDDEKTMVDVWFSSFMQNYLDGSCITEKGANHYLDYLKTDCAKNVLKKRITSFMEHKGFHFADKELFSDNEETEEEVTPSVVNAVKQYAPTYEISYIDGQDKRQSRTIKNANMNSFVAGIKYRDNYEEMLSKLSEGMEVQLRKDPDNPYDPDAIAVYNGNDHLGYIPKRDIPAIVLNMENDSLTAEIEYVDEENVDLIVPVTFERILTMSDDDLEEFRFYKTERMKYETGYQESKLPITKEEFVEGIKQQRENSH